MVAGIKNKYSITRFLYSELMKVSRIGGQVIRPVFYEFPLEVGAWADTHLNWMMGRALKFSANTEKLGQDQTTFYFPNDYWCNIFTDVCYASVGEQVTLRTRAYDLYAHLRSGQMIPYNDPTTVLNQHDLITNHPVSFKINPLIAKGSDRWQLDGGHLYHNDDGENPDLNAHANVYLITAGNVENIDKTRVTITFTMVQSDETYKDPALMGCYPINMGDYLGDITIYNAALTQMSLYTYTASYVYQDGTTEYFMPNVSIKNDVVTIAKRTDKSICLGALAKIVLIPEV